MNFVKSGLFGQICTPQEGTKINRNALTLHSVVSQNNQDNVRGMEL